MEELQQGKPSSASQDALDGDSVIIITQGKPYQVIEEDEEVIAVGTDDDGKPIVLK